MTLACFAKSAAEALEPGSRPQGARTELVTAVVEAPALGSPGDLLNHDFLTKVEDYHGWSERVPRRVRLAIAGGVAAALLLALFATAILLWMWRQNARAEVGSKAKQQPLQAFNSKPSAALQGDASSHGSIARSRPDSQGKSVVLKASKVEKIAPVEPRLVPDETPPVHAAVNDVSAPDAFTPITNEHAAEVTTALAPAEAVPSVSLAISRGATPARLQQRVEPLYPPDARRLRIEGAVVLRAAIDEAGHVKSVALVNGNPMLANAAIAAVRQWRYAPSELNHRPTASTTDITILFHLQ